MLRKILIALAIPPVLLILLFGFIYLNTFNHDWTEISTDFSVSPMLHTKPQALTEPVTLKVVTFNIQDLLVVARNHEERMKAIAVKLGQLDPDIVGFQEAFIGEHRGDLIEALKKQTRLRHFQYYASAYMGSGLLTASVYPIKETWFHQYKDSNPWWKVWEGDYWAGKGVSLARIETPGGIVDFFNTHAQAGYGVPANAVVRQHQMAALGKFVSEAKLGTVPAIVVGDLNSRIGGEDYNAAVTGANLVRTMNVDSRIDHILMVNDPAYKVEVLDTVEIYEQVTQGEKTFELSDHKGYMSMLRISPAGAAVAAADAAGAADDPPAEQSEALQ